MSKSIAFFDFDGTVTKRDTMLEFAKFCAGKSAYLSGMLQISPWLIAMKCKLVSKQVAKEKLLTHFFGGMNLQHFNEKCRQFTDACMPSLIKDEAMAAITLHKEAKRPIVVVSASAENWVAPWCEQNGFICIASRLQVVGDKVTGKLLGANCNGKEKVSRINEMFSVADFENIYCYGDTGGDKEMLAMASHPFFRCYK
ncbi:MAG: haloacid dehalogenase-like hydrolase [Sphingobacteriales bacterium]|nr:MAG: haloacid dehalogenase-like hydrolase [Sphingobacteriales bacterium]